MKLYYDKKSKDPTYFVQIGFRKPDGKPATKNIKRLGKHSELLKAGYKEPKKKYFDEIVRQMNEEIKSGKSEYSFIIDFNKKLDSDDGLVSKSTAMNIGYSAAKSKSVSVS